MADALTSLYTLDSGAYGSKAVIPATSTNTSHQITGWETSLPNYAALAGLQSSNIENQLQGILNPQDLANAQTWAAQRGITTGTGFGSPNNMAAYQQFLGLSAQALEQKGQENLNAALNAAPRSTTSDSTQTIDNNVLAAIYASAPDPYKAALANMGAQSGGLSAGGLSLGTLNNPALGTANVAGSKPPAWTTVSSGPGGASAISAADRANAGRTVDAAQAQADALSRAQGNNSVDASAQMRQQLVDANARAQAERDAAMRSLSASMNQTTNKGGVIGPNGHEWVPVKGGYYQDSETGQLQVGAPGGSSIFGAIQTGNNQITDPYDPFYGTAAQSKVYASMPDYSKIGADPIGAALGFTTKTNPGNNTVSKGSMYTGSVAGYGGDFGLGTGSGTTDFYQSSYSPNYSSAGLSGINYSDPWNTGSSMDTSASSSSDDDWLYYWG